MKISFFEHSLLLSTAVIFLSPSSTCAFAPHHHYERFKRIDTGGEAPSKTTLNYVDTDLVEMDSLVDIRARKLENFFRRERKVVPHVSEVALFLVSRLSSVLQSNESLKTGSQFEILEVNDDVNISPLVKAENSWLVDTVDTDSIYPPPTTLVKVDSAVIGPWSLPISQSTKNEKPKEWGLPVHYTGKDAKNEEGATSGSPQNPKPEVSQLPYFAARQTANMPAVAEVKTVTVSRKESNDVNSMPASRDAASVLTSIALSTLSTATTSSANRDAVSHSPPDLTHAAETVVHVFGVARGLFESLLLPQASSALKTASSMAREYAANLQKKHLTPSPPKAPPSDAIFDLESVLQQIDSSVANTEMKKASTCNIDFEEIDDVLKQAESALKLAEACVESKKPTTCTGTSTPTSTFQSIGNNIDFTEIDHVLMEAESALKLAEAIMQ